MTRPEGQAAAGGARLEPRSAAHVKLGGLLGDLDDLGIRQLVAASPPDWRAWGGSHAITVDGHPVFVKRVPVTDLEMDHGRTTRNIFELPLYYSYGVGSAGFGAFRELAAHEQATELALSGATGAYPLLHHARVVARAEPAVMFPYDLDEYCTRWAGNGRIRAYIEARAASRHELWTFSEAIPSVVHDWIPTHLDQIDPLIDELLVALEVLGRHGTVHFDAHFGNILTDGSGFFVSDFGLALSRDFELDEHERRFLERHRSYDAALVLWCLGATALRVFGAREPAVQARVARRLGVDGDAPDERALLVALLDRVDESEVSGAVGLPDVFVAALVRFRDVIVWMDGFLRSMRQPAKSAQFDDDAVRALLDAAGVEFGGPRDAV